jgi:hypothetical protein
VNEAAFGPTWFSWMHPIQLWELACLRRRPASRPDFHGCTRFNCGSEPAREDGLTADLALADVLIPLERGLPAKAA